MELPQYYIEDDHESISDSETKITLRLWEKFKTGIYGIYLSQVDFTEMDKCEEPKLSFLKEKLNEIDFEILEVKPSTQALVKEIINIKTINGVRAITIFKNQKNINILNPLTLLEMEV